MKVSAVLLLLLTTCAFLPRSTTALNILGIFAYPSFHHWTVHNALITELSKRGHNLTVITNYPTTEATSNYREIHVKPFYDPEIEGKSSSSQQSWFLVEFHSHFSSRETTAEQHL